MSIVRSHAARNLLLGTLISALLMACGQRGPLVLPEEAKPVQRIEVPQPPPPPQAPEQQDDEQKTNER
jgi:predicted small lipoprotein YifL